MGVFVAVALRDPNYLFVSTDVNVTPAALLVGLTLAPIINPFLTIAIDACANEEERSDGESTVLRQIVFVHVYVHVN